MKKTKILAISFLLQSCLTWPVLRNSTTNEVIQIPKGAKEVYISSQVALDSVFNNLVITLMSNGHRIQKEDKDRLYLTTEGHDIGQSTFQRMVVSKQGNRLKILTEWKLGSDVNNLVNSMTKVNNQADWQPCYYYMGRPALAFAETIKLATTLEDVEVEIK